MSATKITLFELQGKTDPKVQAEIKLLSTKESEHVISTIATSDEWKANEGSLALIKTFGLKIGTPITDVELIALATAHGADFSLYKNGAKVALNPTTLLISPSTASKASGVIGTQQYTNTVSPSDAPQTVTWSIQAATGLSINQSGLVSFTASTPPGTYTITTRSTVDNTKTDTATITLT